MSLRGSWANSMRQTPGKQEVPALPPQLRSAGGYSKYNYSPPTKLRTAVFSTGGGGGGGGFAPWRHLAMYGDIFGHHAWGRYWHLVGRGQG